MPRNTTYSDLEFYHSYLRNRFVLHHLLEICYLFSLTENDTQYYIRGSVETAILKVKNANITFDRSVLLLIKKFTTLLDPVFLSFYSLPIHRNANANHCSMT